VPKTGDSGSNVELCTASLRRSLAATHNPQATPPHNIRLLSKGLTPPLKIRETDVHWHSCCRRSGCLGHPQRFCQLAMETAPPYGHPSRRGTRRNFGGFPWNRSRDCLSIRTTRCKNLRRRPQGRRPGRGAVRVRGSPGGGRTRFFVFFLRLVGAQHLRRRLARARSDRNEGGHKRE
jgi:hypothetical protein